MSKNNQKGVSLYLAFMVLTILTAIGLGLATISINQVKMLREMGYSVLAFYAADTGIEKVLVDREIPNTAPDYYSGSLDNEASFRVVVTQGGEGSCPADKFFCLKSIGQYKEVSRAIEVNY